MHRPQPEYQYYRGLLQDEVNAAIDGACSGRGDRVPRERLALLDAEPAPRRAARPGPLPLRAAQADVHDAGARRVLRRRVLRQLPRLDGQRGVHAVAHLQPARPSAGCCSTAIEVGESGINCLVALGHGVPGRADHRGRHDRRGGRARLPGDPTAVVKDVGDPVRGRLDAPGRGRRAHPGGGGDGRARAGRRAPARDRAAGDADDRLFGNGDFAEMATWVDGVRPGRRPARSRSPTTTPYGCSAPSSPWSC